MRIDQPGCQLLADEVALMETHLPLAGASILELGCGDAQMTRKLAERFPVAKIVATEVDEIQHVRNLRAAPPPKVTFLRGGAERIESEDDSFDIVLMLKSLHHVPDQAMDQALGEIARVVRSGGHAWISEPVFAGEFNEVMRIFHDEQRVRELAFSAVARAVDRGSFDLVRQIFFQVERRFSDFEDFRQRMIGVTHTRHQLDESVLSRVRETFDRHQGPENAVFHQPMRVDILQIA